MKARVLFVATAFVAVLFAGFARTRGRAQAPAAIATTSSIPTRAAPTDAVGPARKPANAPTAIAPAPTSVAEYESRIANAAACYASESCDYPKTYPREYSNNVSLSLKRELLAFANFAEARRARSRDIADSARAQLAVPDGHVKEAALRLLATQDPAPENRDAILSDVIGYHDANLIPQALLELRRYDLAGSPSVHDALIDSIMTGAPFVAGAVADGIGPFINEASYPRYADALSRLEPGTRSHAALEAALEQYRLSRTGA